MRSDKQVDRIAASTRVRTYRGPRFQPLRRAVKLPVWGDLGIRLGAALFLIFIVIMVHWWDREGLGRTRLDLSVGQDFLDPLEGPTCDAGRLLDLGERAGGARGHAAVSRRDRSGGCRVPL